MAMLAERAEMQQRGRQASRNIRVDGAHQVFLIDFQQALS
jgi:hypothetical protein